MKKLAMILTAALLALMICTAATANDTAAKDLYDSAVKLLFYTDNATLNATAEFSLDGEWFKTAEVTLKQDGNRSLHQLFLRSPKADGSERQNGYTIVVNGEKLFLMEVFTPGVYRSGTTSERDSFLRRSAESGLMLQLGYALAGQADTLLGSGALTQEADGSCTLKVSGEIPLLLDAAAGQLFRFAAERYFDMDYDGLSANTYMNIDSYGTKTAGILYATREVSIREIAITAKTDAEGRLQHAEGTVGLYIGTVADGVHQLDITFRADVSDIGSTVLKRFDPADYGVTRAANDGITFMEGGEEIPEEAYPAEVLPENGALIDEIELKSMAIWPETGFDMRSTTSVSCRLEGNHYVVSLEGGDDVAKKAYFKEDGTFTGIQAEPNDWQQVSISQYTYEPTPDAETDRKAKEFLMQFLNKATPEVLESVKDLKMEWIYETNGAVYAQYNEYPLDQEGDGVLLVVRLSPDMRIEYYSCESNG